MIFDAYLGHWSRDHLQYHLGSSGTVFWGQNFKVCWAFQGLLYQVFLHTDRRTENLTTQIANLNSPALMRISHKGKRRNPYQTQILVRDENFDQKYVSKKNSFIFSFCIYFPSIHTTSFSSQLHPPRWLEQNFHFSGYRKTSQNAVVKSQLPFFRATASHAKNSGGYARARIDLQSFLRKRYGSGHPVKTYHDHLAPFEVRENLIGIILSSFFQ